MRLPSIVILPCPECGKPLEWLVADAYPGFVVCHHCDGMFDYELVTALEFSQPPRRPGPEGRSARELEEMKRARAQRAFKRRNKRSPKSRATDGGSSPSDPASADSTPADSSTDES